MVLNATGKTRVYQTATMIVLSEKPNQIRNSGSQAMPESDWKNRSGGLSSAAIQSLRPMTNPAAIPIATPVTAASTIRRIVSPA